LQPSEQCGAATIGDVGRRICAWSAGNRFNLGAEPMRVLLFINRLLNNTAATGVVNDEHGSNVGDRWGEVGCPGWVLGGWAGPYLVFAPCAGD
jgi:hypothetical protein